MRRILIFLLLVGSATTVAAEPDPSIAQTYKTSKDRTYLEKCLVKELGDMGDQTLMQEKDSSTLMIRNGEGRPLLIDISPPAVTITTRSDLDTRLRVQSCL